jgi:hypothetical protein
MENRYLVTWQWDNEGDAGLVKVMSFHTYAEATTHLWAQNAGKLLDRMSNQYEYWVSPSFTGKVATSLNYLASK